MSLNEPQPNRTPKYIHNPLFEDFSVNYATDEGPSITYTIHAQDIQAFPTYLANHITKHLAHHIVTTRGVKTNYDDDLKEAIREIEDVDLKV